MAYIENPARLYINLSTFANGASAFATEDPLATYRESRSQPILANVSLYKFTIVRAALTGNRNFPLLIADIQDGQPNPWLTRYQFNLSLTVTNNSDVTPVLPDAVTKRRRLVVTVYDPSGMAIASVVGSVFGPTMNSIANVAAEITTSVQNLGLLRGDPTLQTFTASVNGNFLKFGCTVLPGYSVSVQPYAQSDCQFWGFPFVYPQAPSFFDGEGLELSYPCSWVPSSTTGPVTLTSPGVIIWAPQVSGLVTPRPPTVGGVDSGNESYFLYDITWFVRLFQTALTTAWSGSQATSILSQADALGISIQTTPPTVSYNSTTRKFVLSLDATSAGPSSLGFETFAMSLNEEFANLLAWPGVYDRSGNVTSLLLDNVIHSDDYSRVLFTGEYSATGNGWSPVGSIVFTSALFPTRAEVLSAPLIAGASGIPQQNSSAETAQIVSDVVPGISDTTDFNAYPTLYTPTFPRWVDMPAGARVLDVVDFQVGWRNLQTGVVTPVSLNPTSGFSVKILLQRRDVPD